LYLHQEQEHFVYRLQLIYPELCCLHFRMCMQSCHSTTLESR